MRWLGSPEIVRSPALRYGIAILTVGIVLSIKLLLDPLIAAESPFLLFFMAVMVSTAFGGFSAGIVTTFLAAISIDVLLLAPEKSILTQDVGQNLRLALFLLESSLISLVISKLKDASRQIQLREEALRNAYLDMEKRVEERTTELQQQMVERQQAEENLRSFFDSASMMMGIVELEENDIRHITDNATVAQFFGLTTEQMQNQLATELGAPLPHIQMWMKYYQQAERTQGPVRFEYPHQTAEEEHWLSATVCRIPVVAGQPARFSYIVEDITERRWIEDQLRQLNLELEQRVSERTKELEETNHQLANEICERERTLEELRDSQERFRQLAETVEDVFWLTDWQTYQVLYVSPAYERIWGRSRQQLYDLPEDWIMAIHPDDQAQVQSNFYERVTQGNYDSTYRIVQPDGNIRWVRDRGFPIYNPEGNVYRVAGLAEDITERKQIELTLQRQSYELALANRLKDEFLATISHELRTPLNSMLGWTKLLPKRQLNPETTQRAIDAIARNTQALAQLVEDVLDMSDIMTGRLHLEAMPVPLDLTIEQAISTIQLAAEAKKISICSNLNPAVGLVLGDAARLQQIVWNLLSNAVKFTPTGGHITITLSEVQRSASPEEMPQAYAQIIVKDTGKGISPDFLPFVFDRFRQEDGSTTRLHGGLGLGLAIVRYLVEQHGGKVWAESPGEGQGSTITVELPLLM